jgi:hypothetical protein
MKYAIAGFLAMTILMPVFAAEEAHPQPDRKRESPVSPESKKKADGYDAAVRQCQSQSGTAKQECVEGAKMKYGEMLK